MYTARTALIAVAVALLAGCSTTSEPEPGGPATARVPGDGGNRNIASITVTPSDSEITIGQKVQYTAIARNSKGDIVPTSFSWTTDQPGIANISAAGLVSGIATGGPVRVTATAGSGKNAKSGSGVVRVNGQGRILFQESDYSLWMVNRDGTGRTLVYPGPAMHPDLSHDALWVVHSIPSVNEIWRRRVDGSVAQQLTFSSPPDYLPAWSPDDSRIAWTHETAWGAGNREIFTMNADGSGPTQLTTTPGIEENTPAWSPDGRRIVFSSNRDGDPELYVMNADGSGPVRLTVSAGGDDRPAWSPDGSRIVWESQRDGGDLDLFMMNTDGTNVVQLTANATNDMEPRFSPDGRWLIYTSDESGVNRLYTMRLDGTGRTMLQTGTAPATGASSATWR